MHLALTTTSLKLDTHYSICAIDECSVHECFETITDIQFVDVTLTTQAWEKL
jgi:hypothetical protein